MRLDGLANARDLVTWQIIHHNDVARFENRCQELFGPGPEGFAVHRAIQRHGCIKSFPAQRRDEGGGAPVAMGRFRQQSLADGATAIAAHHAGGKA